MWIARLAGAVYLALLTLLLLAPNPAALLGMRRIPRVTWDVGIHFVAFVLVGVLVPAARPPLRRAWLILVLVAYAVGVELAQSLVPPRTVQLLDMIENLAGLAVGALIWLGIERLAAGIRRRGRHVRKKSSGVVVLPPDLPKNTEG